MIRLVFAALALCLAANGAGAQFYQPGAPTPAYLAAPLFGTGVDGNVTCSGATTLTRDMQYANLTLVSGCAITTNGYRVYVANLLDLSSAPSGAFQNAGYAPTAASGATGGVANGPTGGFPLPWELYTIGVGGSGSITTGTNPTQSNPNILYGMSGREMMLERQKVGIAKAKAEGRYHGRRPVAREKTPEVMNMYAKKWPLTRIAAKLGISRSSVHNIVSAARN